MLPSFDRQARCRILAVLRLSFFLSLKTYSKTLMENEKRALWGALASLKCPDTSALKGKTKQKTVGSRRGTRRENLTTGGNGSTTGVGLTTVRPWLLPRAVVPTGGGSPLFPMRRVLGSFSTSPWAVGFAFSWAFWPLFKLLLILMAHTSLAWIRLKHFSPNLGLNHRNLQ